MLHENSGERKGSENVPKKSEEDFRMLFENSPVSIWEEDCSEVKRVLDDLRSQGVGSIEAYFQHHPEVVQQCAELVRIIDVNHATLALHGATSKEELLQGLARIFTPESYHAFRNELVALWNGKTEIKTDGVVKTLAGEQRNVSIYFSVCPGSEQTLSRVLISLIDITERKRAETEREHFYKFFQTSADLMVIADPNGAFVKTNPACTETLGYSETELVARPFIEFVHPEDKQSTLDEMARQLQRGFSLNFENRYLCKDGSVRWLSWRAVYNKDEGTTYATARDITEHKRAEEALQKSETRFRRTLDNMLEGCVILDFDWTFLYLNETAARHVRNKRENLIGRTLLEMYPGVEKSAVFAGYRRCMEERIPQHFEESYTFADGITTWYSFSVEPIPEGIFVLSLDVTERKQAEEVSRESYERFQLVLDSLDALVYVADMTTHEILFLNRYGRERWGDAVGRTCWKALQSGQTGPCPFCTNARLVLPTGEAAGQVVWELQNTVNHHWYECRDQAIRWTDGRLVRMEIATDITESRGSKELIKNILECVDEGFVILDRDFRILSANRAYANMISMSVDGIVGRKCYEVSRHTSTPCFETGHECAVKRVFETRESHACPHIRQDSKGQTITIETKAYPLSKDGSGEVVTAIVTLVDMTEKQRLEDQLRQAQKMEGIGQFAGGIAHDFNNILTTIIGYGNIALMKMSKDDPQRLNIGQILEAGGRAAHLTKDLLLFSRKQISERKPIDLNEIIRKMEKFLKRVIGEDVECRTTLSIEALPILGDAHQLEQVLMNLATNARDAMPTGGIFSIATNPVKFDAEFVSVHGYGKPGNYVLTTISDSGKGMDEATREHIFEPFFTTKDVGKGTGLGLAVVYGIIKQHEGFINVYSEPGHGTIFNIYLPLIGAGMAEEKKTIEERPTGGTETILLAEDDDMARDLTRHVLEAFGYNVIVANDGQEAVNRYKENKDAIHLLLFDIIMPKKTGKEAYDEIMAMTPGVKVLFVSGYAPDMVRQKVLLEDRVPVVFKPITPVELLKKVRETLDRPILH